MHSQYHGLQSSSLSDFGRGLGTVPSTSLGVSHLLGPSSSSSTTVPIDPKEELKDQFATREGTYRRSEMSLADFAKVQQNPRSPLNQHSLHPQPSVPPSGVTHVRVSFVRPLLREDSEEENGRRDSGGGAGGGGPPAPSLINGAHADDDPMRDAETFPERMCFNIGRELLVYFYKPGAAEATKLLDKRIYKGTAPSCHQFNEQTATSRSCSILVGFTLGQLQVIDPLVKEFTMSRLYNEDRQTEKTAVTCVQWVPGHPQHFFAAHSSGCLYLYQDDIPCSLGPPTYHLHKQGERYAVHTCKTKTPRNPLLRWTIGHGPIHQFAFSPADRNVMAVVSHDGYLRLFNHTTMDLLCYMKSYFGGLLCLAWSPDGALVATGGEDDLVTVYSFAERRMICRGQGHKSWIGRVAFDPYTCVLDENAASTVGSPTTTVGSTVGGGGPPLGSEEDLSRTEGGSWTGKGQPSSSIPSRRPPSATPSTSRLSSCSGTPNGTITAREVSYRLGTVGYDTQLCLWDITDDILKQSLPSQRHRNSTLLQPLADLQVSPCDTLGAASSAASPASSTGGASTATTGTSKDKEKKKRLHKRGFAFAAKLSGSGSERRRSDETATHAAGGASPLAVQMDEDARLLGTRHCPRLQDLPLIEPLICKKIANERITTLEFRRDCFVTACQEGFICTWSRPGKGGTSVVRRDAPSTVPVQRTLRLSAGGHPSYWQS